MVRGGYGLSHAPISGFTQLPQPDFGATSGFATTVPSTTANPNYVMRLGENPPVLTPDRAVAIRSSVAAVRRPTASLTLNSLYYQQSFGGYAVSQNYHTPYVKNWNFTVSWQANSSTTMEVAYTGAMGIHLFMGQENINPKNSEPAHRAACRQRQHHRHHHRSAGPQESHHRRDADRAERHPRQPVPRLLQSVSVV